MSRLPIIGITMGDPAGIGPEIIIKALSCDRIYELCRPVVLGDRDILASVVSMGGYNVELNPVASPSHVEAKVGNIDLVPVSTIQSPPLPGRPSKEGGKAMATYIETAVDMIQRGELAAMVTCPISKELMHRAGYVFDGHTQLIAHLTGCRNYVMMLAGEKLRVALVTIHCALKEVPSAISVEKIYRTIIITADALAKDFGLQKPRLAVAALNPHAGESGLFGSEEEEIIVPAVNRAREGGYHAEGPFPADTVFYRVVSGEFDVVIAMYHDQGLIPLKLLHFSDAVNITLGLPIIRTSVDHGTAYDIAGTGQADESSLKAAIRMASQMVWNRAKYKRQV